MTTCDACGGEMHRLLTAAPFILKGEGWYVTDYPSEARKKAREAERLSTERPSRRHRHKPTTKGDRQKSERKDRHEAVRREGGGEARENHRRSPRARRHRRSPTDDDRYTPRRSKQRLGPPSRTAISRRRPTRRSSRFPSAKIAVGRDDGQRGPRRGRGVEPTSTVSARGTDVTRLPKRSMRITVPSTPPSTSLTSGQARRTGSLTAGPASARRDPAPRGRPPGQNVPPVERWAHDGTPELRAVSSTAPQSSPPETA